MTYRTGTAGLAITLLLAACGSTTTSTTDTGGDEPARPSEDGTVTCGASQYHPDDLADAPSVSSLPDGPAAAVDDVGEPAFDPSLDWKVVYQADDEVELIRELDEPYDDGQGDVRTHESRTLGRITGASNIPDGSWLLTSAGLCAQRLAQDAELGPADLMLADVPSPDDTTLEVLVRERDCASGRSAEGRIEIVELKLTGEHVQLHIGVQPLEGGQDCQGNPPTPYTVDIGEPIGDREVVDASVTPPLRLTVGSKE